MPELLSSAIAVLRGCCGQAATILLAYVPAAVDLLYHLLVM